MDLVCFLAAAISNRHEMVGVVHESAKDDGAVGRGAIGFYGG